MNQTSRITYECNKIGVKPGKGNKMNEIKQGKPLPPLARITLAPRVRSLLYEWDTHLSNKNFDIEDIMLEIFLTLNSCNPRLCICSSKTTLYTTLYLIINNFIIK